MNKSIRSVLCMSCFCLSMPLLGMESGKGKDLGSVNLEDNINQIASAFAQARETARKNRTSLVASVGIGVLAACIKAAIDLEKDTYLSNVHPARASEDEDFGCKREPQVRVSAHVSRKEIALNPVWIAYEVVAGVTAGCLAGLAVRASTVPDDVAIPRISLEEFERILENIVLNVKIDESKLNNDAQVLWAQAKKRVEAQQSAGAEKTKN